MRRLSAVLLLAACAGGDADVRWVGTTDTLVNGLVRVTNPAEPIWSEETRWRFEPILTLGSADGTGADVFASIADIEVDDAGRIYVLDRQLKEVRIFDADGTHVGTFGRAGEGPGEFDTPNGLEWLPGDSLLVIDGDGGRYSVFDLDGNFGRTMFRPITSYGWVAQGGYATGRLYEHGLRRTGETSEPVLIGVRLDAQAELVDTLSFPVRPATAIESYSVRTDRGGMSMSVPFAPGTAWQLMPDGSMWWGFGGEYRIFHISSAGDTLREIAATSARVPVSAEELDEWTSGDAVRRFKEMGGDLDLGRIPDEKPFFDSFFVDPEGRLWVDVPTATRLTAFDVFDAEGRYLGRLDTGVRRDRWIQPKLRDDKLYFVATDDLDVQQVRVVRISQVS